MLPARLSIRAAAVVALFASSRAGAQCPDGSPGSRCESPIAKIVDPNRIVVLPFRVSAADTLLGEGFAELLAPQFTGEGGPRSIEMSTTLSAWRRGGGGLRTPLAQDRAMRLARELGAGILAQGSVSLFGARLTVSAALVNSQTGAPIGATASASGAMDSIEVVLRQVATSLLGAVGGRRAIEAARLTSSLPALRAYLEGLSLLRRGRYEPAAKALEASIAADSTFASAYYQRHLIASQLVQGGTWGQQAFAFRSHLAPRERTLIEALFAGSGTTRSAAQNLEDRRVAAVRLVDSPEAWFYYGDAVYHAPRNVIGPDSQVTLARGIFMRATALDSQPVLLYHLMEIAARARDTALIRTLLRTYDGLEGEERWPRSWVMAGIIGDAATLAKLRRSGPEKSPTNYSYFSLSNAVNAPIPVVLVDEAFGALAAVSSREVNAQNAVFHPLIHLTYGRPVAASKIDAGRPNAFWRVPFSTWAWVSGDRERDAAFMRAYGTAPLADATLERRRQCAMALLRVEPGAKDSVDLGAIGPASRCGRVVSTWLRFVEGTLTDAEVAAFDTLVADGRFGSFIGVEHRLLARIYEARGDTVRALRAIRLHNVDYAGVWLAPTLREQGRLYLMARDTANAILSYRRFLEFREEAEQPYVAERDSIKALVATLTRKR